MTFDAWIVITTMIGVGAVMIGFIACVILVAASIWDDLTEDDLTEDDGDDDE